MTKEEWAIKNEADYAQYLKDSAAAEIAAAEWINEQPLFSMLAGALTVGAHEHTLQCVYSDVWILDQKETGAAYDYPHLPPFIRMRGPRLGAEHYRLTTGVRWELVGGKWTPPKPTSPNESGPPTHAPKNS